jgi:hypothetical protein
LDVPLKFAIPLLLAAALPAGLAVLQNLPAASSSVASVATRAAHVPAPVPAWQQDDAEVARQADEARAAAQARQAAAQTERARAAIDYVLVRDEKTVKEVFHALGDDTADGRRLKEAQEQWEHARAVDARGKLEQTRAENCARSRWKCGRP